MKELTANELTAKIVEYLNLTDFVVWRQNNVGKVAGRYLSAKKGVPDIIGYEKVTGRAIFVEVKVGKDKLSPEQIKFLFDANRHNCYAIVAHDFDQFLQELQIYDLKFKQL